MLSAFALLTYVSVLQAQQVMDIHSFNKEIDHPTFLSRWWNAGASIPLENHIVLLPSVSDRYGAQWHKHPILTNDFEVTFTVVVKPPASGKQPPNNQGFAFWYVYDNVTDTMPREFLNKATDVMDRLTTAGWGLFGYKNTFKGIGVTFANQKGVDFKPSVSLIVNDGTRNVQASMDIPTPHGSFWNFRNGNLDIRLRIQQRAVSLDGRQDSKGNWMRLGEIKSDKLPMNIDAGGYMGFTGHIAADKPGQPRSQFGDHDSILIDNVVLTNMDTRQKGEEKVAVPAAPVKIDEEEQQRQRAEILHDKSDEAVERAEGMAIKKFSQVLFKFISETEPQKKSIMSAITTLSGKLSIMERAVKKLKDEIVELSGHDMDGDYAKMKAELAELSSKALNDVAHKKKQFETIKSELESSIVAKNKAKRTATSNVVKTLHEVDSKARDLKKQVASRGSFTLYVALICVVLVVLAGFALQAKLKKWEKKHLL